MSLSDGALRALAAQLSEQLRARKQTVTTAESCTGGWIAKVITDLAGSSAVFTDGFVTYSNAAKTRRLGVSNALLAAHGAVSEEVVHAMAAGALAHAGADYAVAVSGVAGPGGGSETKPVGTVWLAFAGGGDAPTAECHVFAGDRDAVRRATVARALAGVLERVMASA